jgi:hypothetical protein
MLKTEMLLRFQFDLHFSSVRVASVENVLHRIGNRQQDPSPQLKIYER